MKRVLIVGGGGREHALAWGVSRSPQVEQVYVAPGNAGTEWPANPSASGLRPRAASANVPIGVNDFPALVSFARQHQVDLTIVGPEAPLSEGIVDAFQAEGLRIFGPTREAAMLESSKAFAKDFLLQHDIPTATSATFDNYSDASKYIESKTHGNERWCPVVVKADGLAAGKGVIVCSRWREAHEALQRIMVRYEFGGAGQRVVIEERLEGREVSVMALSDGKHVLTLPPSRDHKPVYDGDHGPNTGGMGAYTHPPDVDATLMDAIRHVVLQPTVNGMAARRIPYIGVLYAGLMLTEEGPQVLEFNCRFGDPEIEAIMPLLSGDLVEVLLACLDGRLDQVDLPCHAGAGATVVLASPGYPGTYPKGIPITGVDTLNERDDVIVFHAGTAMEDGQLVTAGGRVMAVSARGDELPTALQRAYDGISQIHFDGMHYRQDIGKVL